MDNVLLLNKLANFDNKEFELYTFYADATTVTYEDSCQELSTLFNDLRLLTDYQYDFEWLTATSKAMGCNRREIKALSDDVCILLGKRIEDVCKYTKELIVVKPSNIEDYCPFSSESLVAYGSYNTGSVKYDGNTYKIVDTKLESSPYYNIYVNRLDY